MKTLSSRVGIVATFILVLTGLSACSDSDDSAESGVSRYILSNEFLGSGQVLSASPVDNGEFELLFEPAGTDDPEQQWSVEPIENGFYRIRNRGVGDGMSLDVINDGVFDRLILAPTAEVSGQHWQIARLDNEYCRFTNEFLGVDIALDVTNDMNAPQLTLRSIANVSGQNWRLEALGTGDLLDGLCLG